MMIFSCRSDNNTNEIQLPGKVTSLDLAPGMPYYGLKHFRGHNKHMEAFLPILPSISMQNITFRSQLVTSCLIFPVII